MFTLKEKKALRTYQVEIFFTGKSLHQDAVQFTSVPQPCVTFCDPVDCSTPGLPVHPQLPEFAQTHVHRVGDAIQLSHSVGPYSSCPQSFPASGSFQMSVLRIRWLKYWSFSISPSNENKCKSRSVYSIDLSDFMFCSKL